MALNPLQEKMVQSGEVNTSAGLSAQQAVNSIESLLTDDGKTFDDGVSNRDLAESGDGPGADDGDNFDADLQDIENSLDAEDESEADDTADADGDTAQTEGDDDSDAESDGQAETEDQEGEPIDTLAALAEASEMDVAELLSSMSHTFNAAGEEVTATLEDLVKGYSRQADYDRDKTALAGERRVFEAEREQRLESLNTQAVVLNNQYQHLEQVLYSQLQGLNTQSMDAGELALVQQQVNGQIEQLRQSRQQVANQYTQLMNQERQHFMAQEAQKLQEQVEGWGQEKLATAVDTIKSLGYNDDEVTRVVDARLIQGALELDSLRAEVSELRKLKEEGQTAAKSVKAKVPKTVKSGKGTKKKGRGPDRNAVSRLRRSHGQNQSLDSAAKLIESMME